MTGNIAIADALSELGTYNPADPVPSAEMTVNLRYLNRMLGSWAVDRTFVWAITPQSFVVPSGKGGSVPYTIGTGGDFNVQRPISITLANNIVTSVTPSYRKEIELLQTAEEWARITIQDVSSATLFTKGWYDKGNVSATSPTSGLGNLYLYPKLTSPLPTLELYLEVLLTQFADLTTDYEFPLGYERAIVLNLALELAAQYAKPNQDLSTTQQNAGAALEKIRARNLPTPQLKCDNGIGGSRQYGYTNYVPDAL